MKRKRVNWRDGKRDGGGEKEALCGRVREYFVVIMLGGWRKNK